MIRSFTRTVLFSLVLASVSLVIAGCSRLSGTYQDSTGMFSIEFKSGNKATVRMPMGTVETDYKVEGDKVTLRYQGEDLVLTIDKDGSLEGGPDAMIGKLTKK